MAIFKENFLKKGFLAEIAESKHLRFSEHLLGVRNLRTRDKFILKLTRIMQ